MYVIPRIMTEEECDLLTMEMLCQLAACSTSVIKEKIREYIRNPDAMPDIKEKVIMAYSEQLALDAYLNNPDVKEQVDLIKDLSYMSINPLLTIGELELYKSAISSILESKYAMPYIAPISSKGINTLVNQIKEYSYSTRSRQLCEFSETLKAHSKYFRDPQYSSARGTVVKKVIRNRYMYEIILRGIDFMISKKISGDSSWRIL